MRRPLLAVVVRAVLATVALCTAAYAQAPTVGPVDTRNFPTVLNQYLSTGTVTATGGTTAITERDRAAFVVRGEDYGMVCDYNFGTTTGTDNTAAFAAAITAAQSQAAMGAGKILILPPGACLTGPQTVVGQLRMEGSSSFTTDLVLKHGSTTPAITVQTTGSDPSSGGKPKGELYLRNFRVTSEDGKLNNATYPNAAGISLANGTWAIFGYIEHVTVYNMPGDGINGGHFGGGFAQLEWIYSYQNGGNGISLNTSADWTIGDSQIALNLKDGILSSGDVQLYIYHNNVFSNSGQGVHLFGSETVTMAGHNEFNLNGDAGLYLDTLSSTARVTIGPEISFGSNSQSTSATWAAVNLNGGSGTVTFIGTTFPAPFAVNSQNSELANFTFLNTSTTSIYCLGCVFLAGSPTQANVTNQQSSLFTMSAVPGSAWQLTGALSSNAAITGTSISGTGLTVSGPASSPATVTIAADQSSGSGATISLTPRAASGSGIIQTTNSAGLLFGTNSVQTLLLRNGGGLQSSGTKFTASGCSNSTTVGGATAGSFHSGTTGTCTVVITLAGATGTTMSNGWSCRFNDETTPANLLSESGYTTTTVTMTGTTNSGDVIDFACTGF